MRSPHASGKLSGIKRLREEEEEEPAKPVAGLKKKAGKGKPAADAEQAAHASAPCKLKQSRAGCSLQAHWHCESVTVTGSRETYCSDSLSDAAPRVTAGACALKLKRDC